MFNGVTTNMNIKKMEQTINPLLDKTINKTLHK